MKALKIILTLTIGVMLGVVGAVAFYFFTESDVAWEIYIEEKLAPNVVIVLSAVGSLLVAAMPIINRVQLTLEKFGKATQDISDTVQNGKKTDQTLDGYNNTLLGYNDRIAAFEYRFDRLEQVIAERLSPIEKNTSATRKMAQIGFCNTGELVRNGYAAEIAKVNKRDGALDLPKNDAVENGAHDVPKDDTVEDGAHDGPKDDTVENVANAIPKDDGEA